MPGRFRPRGEMMRDCSKNRAGFDRVLMAVAATFLTVSATSALAQSDPARNSAAELAIDAAVPRPEPANVPPPTVNDFKPDTTLPPSSARRHAKGRRGKSRHAKAERKPADVATAPAGRHRQARHRQDRYREAADTRETNRHALQPASDTGEPRRPPRLPPTRRPPRRRPPNRSRPPATFRPPISRSPTNCATCSAQNRCAISTARPNARRWKNSTPRATLRRCGPRAAR